MSNIKVKQWEVWFKDFTRRWNKNPLWDSLVLVCDAWLDGYKHGQMIDEANKEVEIPDTDENRYQLGALDRYGTFTMQERLERDFGKMYGCQYIKCVEDEEDILVFAKFKNRYK